MGGFASGLAQAGFGISWATDSDAYACASFRHRFPGVRVLEMDVQNLHVNAEQLNRVDVLVAGFPCQSFSQAGNRLGFDDPRGELFFEILRLIEEFNPEDRPPLLILENVPYLLVGAQRSWFDQIQRSLRRSGYWFRENSCWTANVKTVTDLPQDRNRLFLVAASRRHFRRNPYYAPTIPRRVARRPLDHFVDRTQRSTDDAYLSPENRYYKMINEAMRTGQSPTNIYQLRRSYVREKKDGLCPTLTANMGIGGHNVPFLRDSWGVRKMTVTEVARLQGFSSEAEDFPDIPVTEKYRLLGNAVCVKLAVMVAAVCADILKRNQP